VVDGTEQRNVEDAFALLPQSLVGGDGVGPRIVEDHGGRVGRA